MSPDLKAVAYALHDTYGYHADIEEKAKEVLRILNRSGWFVVDQRELDRLSTPLFSGEEMATIHDLAMDEIRSLQDMIEVDDDIVAPQLAVVNGIRDKTTAFFENL